MNNEQNRAARKVFNPKRSTIQLETTRNADGSETFTPFLANDPSRRGSTVTITSETSPGDVTRLFTAAIIPLV
jgi:hypothetical protein